MSEKPGTDKRLQQFLPISMVTSPDSKNMLIVSSSVGIKTLSTNKKCTVLLVTLVGTLTDCLHFIHIKSKASEIEII